MTLREQESIVKTINKLRDIARKKEDLSILDNENCDKVVNFITKDVDELLMKHYRQGVEDEKARQKGQLMQAFNPD